VVLYVLISTLSRSRLAYIYLDRTRKSNVPPILRRLYILLIVSYSFSRRLGLVLRY